VSTCKSCASVHDILFNRNQGLADAPSIEAIRANIKGPKTRSGFAAMMIKTNLLTTLDYISGGTSRNDMPTTWIHEMGHALNNCKIMPTNHLSRLLLILQRGRLGNVRQEGQPKDKEEQGVGPRCRKVRRNRGATGGVLFQVRYAYRYLCPRACA
jgi:hypothetical protein